ncbi:FAD-dependent oxidoreductase [Mycolicibacterium sp.]|uniref:NAD(P)/FAD-dependent oxidoreductase n=1 Tax=Mycolicibacterium sp. TaxID=2320850 RepID=UPI001A2046E5|nr:FAD-dependent oxidoreductase [Mycolicibacterium sp.]MBJ7398731.1 FAD-dependent oxidoreductase [Mycolicibacterium sp.]
MTGVRQVAVAIVGGGPAGLTAAATLAPVVDGEVLVIERETHTGGIPCYSDHLGYGIRDLRRFISGPAYARRLSEVARDAGAVLTTEAMVTGWAGPHRLAVTSPAGRQIVEADAVVLATGARERPRAARLIPGDRPDGVYTTGALQQMVHRHRRPVGTRALIVGAELVSWSAVLTLREAGCTPVAMTTVYPHSEAYTAFRIPGQLLIRGPVLGRTRMVSITGSDRVESAVVEHLDTGRRTTIDCDTVVFTGDWIPDHELARSGELQMDPATRGPVVDAGLRTSRPGVFAVGNLLHPVDTAAGAALDGRHVGPAVQSWLKDRRYNAAGIRLRTDAPLRWVTPQLIPADGHGSARGDLRFWLDEYVRMPKLLAVQNNRVIGSTRTLWPAAPGRIYRAPWTLVSGADPAGGEVTISLR